MKFSKYSGSSATGVRRRGSWSQLLLVSAAGLAVAGLLSACQLVTIDYVFLTGTYTNSSGASSGGVQAFAVDSESGALRNAGGNVASGGLSPVAMATTSDYAHMYVANADNDTLVHFTIASDGVLTQKDTVTLPGTPVAIAVNNANSALYVIYGQTSANLAVYSLSSGTIGSVTGQAALQIPGYTSDLVVPTAVTVLQNNGAVYATVYDMSSYNPGGTTTSTVNPGWVFGFTTGTNGALTPASGSPWRAGVKPTGIVADPTDRFVYITDYASNHLIGYTVTSGVTLNYIVSGPFTTGNEPSAVTIDPRGKYLYVSNALDSTVTAYAIDLATGIPSQAINTTGSQINSTDTQPDAIVVDPALGRYVFTANHLGDSISGFRLNPDTGQISATQATPYPADQNPTAIVAVPHGNHSLQTTTP